MNKFILALSALNAVLILIILKKQKIMADNLTDLSAQVDDLQITLDGVQGKITTAVDGLNGTVKQLQDIIATGGGGDAIKAQIQAVSDKITKIKEDLQATDLDGSESGTGEEDVVQKPK